MRWFCISKNEYFVWSTLEITHTMTSRLALCFLFVTSIGWLTAQINLDQAIHFNNTTELNSLRIKKIVEGPFGFIWIASDEGLFRFDGSMLQEVFEGNFEDIDIDEINHQFIFTSRTRLILQSFDEERSLVIPRDSLILGDFILQATSILSDTSYWIASTYGITHFHPFKGKIRSFQMLNAEGQTVELTGVAPDPHNKALLWFGSKTGLFSFNVDTYQYSRHWLSNARRKDRERELNSFDALYVHDDGKVYCGSWGAGLAIYSPGTGEIEHFTTELGPRDYSHVYAIIPETDTTIWISATTGSGRYNTITEKMTSYTSSKVLDDLVLDIGPVMIDKSGRYWIGYVNGLRMLDPYKSQIEIIECPIMTAARFYIPRSVAIGRNPNLLYLGIDFSDGLYTYNLKSKEWNCIKVKDAGPGWEFHAWDTHWNGDTLWILDAEGLFYYLEGDQFLTRYQLDDAPNYSKFTSFSHMPNHEIWIASVNAGLYVANTRDLSLKHFSEISTLSNHEFLSKLNLVHKDNLGRLWLCSKNQVYVYLPEDLRFIDLSSHINEGEPFLDIHSISEGNGRIWLSTSTGIYMISSEERDQFKYDRVAPIASNCIESYGKEHLWITTGSSITMLNWQDGSTRKFTESAGLPKTGRHDIERIDLLHNDQLFISARKTFAILTPSSLNATSENPKPYFTSVSIDGIEAELSGLGLSLNYLSILPDQNSVSVNFSAISYSSQVNNKFRYMLEGVNDEWVPSSADNSGPTYVNLDAGDYRLLVEVAGIDDNWSAPAILEIKVEEYWWQNVWFHVVLALIGLGTLIAIYQAVLGRVKRNSATQLRMMNLEKQALQAQMNPHFIFNAMNSIQHFMVSKDEVNAMFYLSRFGKLLRSILDNSSKSYVSLKSEIEMLDNYISLESLRFEDVFEYEIDIDRSLSESEIRVPGFVLQPVVENAIKHGLIPKKGKGILRIALRRSGDILNCIIEDNGVGRSYDKGNKENSERSSLGLKILRARLQLYSPSSSTEIVTIEDLHANDGAPSGTRVTIKLPIQTT